MTNQAELCESFIVRIWWQPGQAAPKVWVEHVRSGERSALRSLEAAAAFIERWAPMPSPDDRPGLR